MSAKSSDSVGDMLATFAAKDRGCRAGAEQVQSCTTIAVVQR